MSDELSEAINVVMFEVTTMLVDSGLPVPDSLVIVTDAARRWANLTSPETIEKAEQIVANDLANIAYNRGWAEEHPNEYLKVAKVLVKAVLRAVEGGSGE